MFGKIHAAALLAPIAISLLSIFLLVVGLSPLLGGGAILVFYGVGLSFFLAAKYSVIKIGKAISFGSKEMSPGNRKLYRIGYALMVLGSLIAILWLFRR